MVKEAGRLVGLSLIALATACGSSTPTSPSSVPNGYSGTWTGQTLQGGTITFTVSQDQRVVSLALSLGGCVGSRTFSDLSLPIERPQLAPASPTAGSPFDNPGFGYGSGPIDQPNFLSVYGAFTSSSTAMGVLTFSDYQGCGNGVAAWSATRR